MEAWSPNHWTPGKSLPSAHKDIDLKFSCLKEHPFLPLSLVPQLIDLQMLELQGSIFGICLSAPLGGKVPRLYSLNARLVHLITHFTVGLHLKDYISKTEFLIFFPLNLHLGLPISEWSLCSSRSSSEELWSHSWFLTQPSDSYVLSSLNISWIWPKPHHLTPGSHEQSAKRASCSWRWSNQQLEEPFWDIRHAWAPLCSKPSDGSHLTQSKIHSPTMAHKTLMSDPLIPVTSSSMILILAYSASGTLFSLLLLQHTRTLLEDITWSSLGASVLPSTCLECFPPEELQESPLHISSGMSSNVIHQEGFP